MKFRKLLSAGIAAVIAVCSVEAFSITSSAVYLDEQNFPDDNFRRYLYYTFDNDNDNYLSSTECAGITSIDVSKWSVTSLEGIENFTNLKTLNCSNCKLTSLDVSSLDRLDTLDCSNNMLKSLSYSDLYTLDCSYNQLESISVNRYIVTLKCSNNKIRNLDLIPAGYSANNNLVTLDCSNNRLGCLDIRDCNKLNQIKTENNCYELGSNVIELRGDSTLLPVGFEMQYTSDWKNAHVDWDYNSSVNSNWSISNITNKIITYDYEISSGSKVKFSMYADNDGLPGSPPWTSSGGSTINPDFPIGETEGVIWANGKDLKDKDPKNDKLYKTWKFHHCGMSYGGTWNVVTTNYDIDTVEEFLLLFNKSGKLNESGKRIAKASKAIAFAKIKQGDVTVTAGKESGTVRVWVYELCNKQVVNDPMLGVVPTMRTVTVLAASGKPCISTDKADFEDGVLLKGKKIPSKIDIIYNADAETQEPLILYYGDKKSAFSDKATFIVESSEKMIVSAELGTDNTIVLTPLSLGPSKITLKNIESGKSITFKVTVKEP